MSLEISCDYAAPDVAFRQSDTLSLKATRMRHLPVSGSIGSGMRIHRTLRLFELPFVSTQVPAIAWLAVNQAP